MKGKFLNVACGDTSNGIEIYDFAKLQTLLMSPHKLHFVKLARTEW